MNSRVLNIILPIIAIIIYLCINLFYLFLARSRYEPVIEQNILKDKMQLDAVAGISCYASQ
jgi:hypothetical protein